MRAHTFAGQIIAVLSRRASAFEPSSGEPQTFPGRLRALLSHPRHPTTASPTPTNTHPVITSEPQAQTPETVEPPASGHTEPPKHQRLEAREFDFEIVRALAHELRCHEPDVRLRVRAHKVFTGLEHSLQCGHRALDRARNPTRDLRNHDLAYTIRTLDLTRDLAHTLHNLDLDSAHDHDLAHIYDRSHVFDRTRDREVDPNLARELPLTRDLDLDAMLTDLDDDPFDLSLIDLSLIDDLALIRELDLDAVLANLDSALHDLDGALHDFTTADLRRVDLAGVPLEGVRWSSATQWPADWAPQVALASVEVAPDVFEVREGNTHVPTSV